MNVSCRFSAVAVTLAIVAAGCSSRPTAEADAAKAALDNAVSKDADRYASASLQSAQDARVALDAELKAQDGKWVKSYDKARDLAVTARGLGEKAAADAVEGKARADAAAIKKRTETAAAKTSKVVAPLRIGGQIKPPTRIKDVQPIYPPIAKSANVSGVVTIEATIGSDGKVSDARVVQSVPLLDQAALDAVRQWEYMPTLLNGVPVPIVTTINVTFKR